MYQYNIYQTKKFEDFWKLNTFNGGYERDVEKKQPYILHDADLTNF